MSPPKIGQHQKMELADHISHIESHLKIASREQRADKEGLVQLGLGVYLPRSVWERLSVEDQHLARMLAVTKRAAGLPVFSHVSAAVLLGLPLWAEERAVHVTTSAARNGSSTVEMVRHARDLNEEAVVEVGGLHCTSPARTLLDLARFAPAETALVCIDAYLRREFRVQRLVDTFSLNEWRSEMLVELNRLRGQRGVRRARQLMSIADPRIDSPLESVSHLQLRRIGFDVDLQVPVRSPRGGTYLVDFGFVGLDVLGECDGKQKYFDPMLRHGASAESAVYQEKRRQDWIEGVTSKRLIRWGWADVQTPEALAARLRAFQVPVPLASRFVVK